MPTALSSSDRLGAPATSLIILLGSVSSPAYLDVEATLRRAETMLCRPSHDGIPARAWRALAVRCEAHADELRATSFVPGVGWRTGLVETQWRHLHIAARGARVFERAGSAS